MATDWSSHCSLADNCANSELKVAKATQVWTINNFEYAEAKGTAMYSPVFSSSTNDKAKWCMRLEPNGTTDEKNAIGLDVCLHKTSEYKKVFAKFALFIFNKEDKVEISRREMKVCEFVVGDINRWGWPDKFCEKDKNFRKKILSNSVLKISCEIIFSHEGEVAFEHHHNRNVLHLKSTAANSDVTKDFDVLLNTHLLADVVISVNGKDYPAHKAILAARSKVFAAMFQHDTKENTLNRVDIEDLSEEIVGELLRFIYVGRCEKLDELAGDLLLAADKYDFDQLKIMCSQALCDNLSVENAAQNLILANMHNANELKTEVMKFIAAKPVEVFDTAGWRKILSYSDPDLLDEIFRAIAARRLMPSDKA